MKTRPLQNLEVVRLLIIGILQALKPSAHCAIDSRADCARKMQSLYAEKMEAIGKASAAKRHDAIASASRTRRATGEGMRPCSKCEAVVVERIKAIEGVLYTALK